MARREAAGRERGPGRFARSGHTSHTPCGTADLPFAAPAGSGTRPLPDPGAPTESIPGVDTEPTRTLPRQTFSNTTYHHTPAAARSYPTLPAQPPAGGVLRRAGRGVGGAARGVTHRVVAASKAGGADRSGLTALIWNQVLSYGTDAMVAVALAGTVFFGASAHAQRGNVLLYLLVTVAPFALVAPVIGPALDRLQHGRRWTMAATGIGRAVLALVMAAHPTELLVLYPCALGSLVLSKAYAVVRAAATPRLVPQGMTLTEANSRLTTFGLGSTLVLGGLVGAVIKLSGSYSAGLVVTAVGFAACGVLALRLPRQVDSPAVARNDHATPHPREHGPMLRRLHGWARRGYDQRLVLALQGESVLRLLSGLLTIFLAFYVETTQHGLTGVLELGAVVGAAGVGNFLGTAVGTRISLARPELVVVLSVCAAGGLALVIAALFSPLLAALGMLVAATANALSKMALDSLIQRDVAERQRTSAFARSETFLQLAWVLGAAAGVALPSNDARDGSVAFLVAGVVTGGVGVLVALRRRAMTRATAAREWPDDREGTGSVAYRTD